MACWLPHGTLWLPSSSTLCFKRPLSPSLSAWIPLALHPRSSSMAAFSIRLFWVLPELSLLWTSTGRCPASPRQICLLCCGAVFPWTQQRFEGQDFEVYQGLTQWLHDSMTVEHRALHSISPPGFKPKLSQFASCVTLAEPPSLEGLVSASIEWGQQAAYIKGGWEWDDAEAWLGTSPPMLVACDQCHHHHVRLQWGVRWGINVHAITRGGQGGAPGVKGL